MMVGGTPFTIVGIMPQAFQFPRPEMEIWLNMPVNPGTRFGPWLYRGMARLKPGVTFDQAQTELNALARILEQENPAYKRVTLSVRPLRDAIVGRTVKPAMYVLSGAVALLLLIAVVNVANLMLARATVRQREIALRLSLGAGRGRVIRQLLTEGVLLSATGGMAGFVFAWCSVDLIRTWNPGDLPLMGSVRLDWSAFAFTLSVSILTGLLFALAPALGGSHPNLNSAMKEGGRGGSQTRANGQLRAALVISEIALSFILLVAAGLLLRSFVNLQSVTGGFSAAPAGNPVDVGFGRTPKLCRCPHQPSLFR
jgi:predicted permease